MAEFHEIVLGAGYGFWFISLAVWLGIEWLLKFWILHSIPFSLVINFVWFGLETSSENGFEVGNYAENLLTGLGMIFEEWAVFGKMKAEAIMGN